MNKHGFTWALLATFVLLSCTMDTHTSSAPIADIQSVSELQWHFEQDIGVPRLLLLLSPT